MAGKTYSDHISSDARYEAIEEIPIIINKDILRRADTDKDGVLSKEEIKSVSSDISNMTKAFLDSKPDFKADMQRNIDELRESFVDLVKKGMDPTNDVVKDSTTSIEFTGDGLDLYLKAVQHGIDFTDDVRAPSTPASVKPSKSSARI